MGKRSREKLENRSTLFQSLEAQLKAEAEVAKKGGEVPGSDQKKVDCTATDVYLADARTISTLKNRELKLRIITYRDLLSSILTEDSYAKLCDELCTTTTENELPDIAHGLSKRLHQRYVLVPAVEDIKESVARSVYACLLSILILAVAIISYNVAWKCSSVFAVYTISAAMGACGATLSTHVRLYGVNPRHEPLLTWLSLEAGKMSLVISPLVGAVFGVVLTMLIHAGIIESKLLPNIVDLFHPGFCADGGLHVTSDVAMCMVWSFAAGWAERTVPDVLNRITRQSPRQAELLDKSWLESLAPERQEAEAAREAQEQKQG